MAQSKFAPSLTVVGTLFSCPQAPGNVKLTKALKLKRARHISGDLKRLIQELERIPTQTQNEIKFFHGRELPV